MFREVVIKLGGATLLLLGIGFLVFGFLLSNKFMQATGFMGSIIAVILLYYTWAVASNEPVEKEPEETKPVAK